MRLAARRGLVATCDIAKELHKILRDELYLAKTDEFSKYITEHLRMDLRTYRRIVAISQTVDQLKAAGLELPANDAQAEQLARLDPNKRAGVWNELLLRYQQEEKTLTADDVRRAVDAIESHIKEPAAPSHAGHVEIPMDDSDNGDAPPAPQKPKEPAQEGQIILTEKGEAALVRIRKICGDLIGNAIAEGTRAMTERDIRNWAEYDDAMMRQLAFFVFDQRYTLARAVNFLNKDISDSTDVSDLILIATARGGSAKLSTERAKITIDLIKRSPQT
jgi:hypothetical protein